MKRLGFAILILLLSADMLWAQKTARIRTLEQQWQAALAEIEVTNQLLDETKKSTRNSLNQLNLLSKQILSRKEVINLLGQEIEEIDKQIASSRSAISQLEDDLKNKRQMYGKSIQKMYLRRNSQDKLLFILSADNFAQSFRRMRYLREYADWQKKQAETIISRQKELTDKQKELEQTREGKNKLLTTREDENRKLLAEESNRKKAIRELNKKQKQLQADLKKKKKQADALNQQIEKLIAEEIARAKTSSKKGAEAIQEERVADTEGGYAMTKAEKQLSTNFAGNKGRLPYPVSGRHTIVAAFGEQQHQELKYVRTNNNGIDIQTTPGADARAVFNGEVTRIFIVPGYNNSVIVRHGNYLTVYSNLSQVYVKAGDHVSTRQAIGKIFTDTEDGNATILHFQLWKEKTKLNPEPWLD